MQNFKKTNKGFTIIELVVVIIIIGILAAVAMPKLIAAQRDARIAKANAMFGSIRVAANLAKARCELDLSQGLVAAGTCGNAAPQVTMDGQVVNMLNNYPAATAAGIAAAANINAASDGLTVAGAGPLTFTVVGATTPATCVISYTAAAAGASPTITVNTAGC